MSFGGQVFKISVSPAFDTIAPNLGNRDKWGHLVNCFAIPEDVPIYSRLTDGVGDDAGHDGPDEADAQDDDDLMALRAMLGDKGLEAQDFSSLILRDGKGNCSPLGAVLKIVSVIQ